jgi:WD40 repeat protein
VTAHGDGGVRIWDLQNGAEKTVLHGHESLAVDCAVSPDASYVVSASADASLIMWDLVAPPQARPRGTYRPVFACTISPDGSFVASTDAARTLTTWDPDTGDELKSRGNVGNAEVVGCAVAPDASFIVTGGGETVALWDPDTLEERVRMSARADLSVWTCAVSPDGAQVLSGSDAGALELFDAYRGVHKGDFRLDRPRQVADCVFAPDGSTAVSVHPTGEVILWDVPARGERAELEPFEGHPRGGRARDWWDAYHGCAFSPDGSFVVAARFDGSLRVWDLPGGHERHTLAGHSGGVTGCGVSPDGATILSAGLDRTVKAWDVASGAQLATLPSRGKIWDVAIHPSLPRIAYVGEGGRRQLADLIGIEYGPLVVSARGRRRLSVGCPACGESQPVKGSRLGRVIACRRCGRELRLNRFFLKSVPARGPR